VTSVDKLMREVAWLITKPEDVPILRRTIQECLRIYPDTNWRDVSDVWQQAKRDLQTWPQHD
jgi:hypothetical protein